MANPKARILVECGRCGKGAVGRIVLGGKVEDDGTDSRGYVLEGAVIPFTPALAVEMMRRGYSGMCVPCWEGKPIPAPISTKPKIYSGDEW